MTMKCVGEAIPRVDGQEKVTGTGEYAALMHLPGMAHAAVLRSPVPHARIRRLDPRPAEQAAGVICVLTREDIRRWGIRPTYGSLVKDQPIVAMDRVLYVGDVVAGVVAETPEEAAAALERIEVEYEELPAVHDPLEALKPSAPVLHPEGVTGLGRGDIKGVSGVAGSNILGQFKIRKGNVEEGFAQADRIFEDEFSVPPISHAAPEPIACVAEVRPDGGIECWTPTQTPSSVREQLSETFGLPESKVRVRVPLVGGAFGSKCYAKIEPLTVALAKKAGRPVRLALSRYETFLTLSRHAAYVRVKTGVKRDGTITARKVVLYFDAGAYADVSPRVCQNGGLTSPGPYRIDNLWVDSYAVYTNKVPAGAFRGYGVLQACWAVECHTDKIAESLGLDPLEIRLKNALKDGDPTHIGQIAEAMPTALVLSKAAEAIGWGEGHGGGRPVQPGERGKRRGKGIACSIKNSTPSMSNATIKMNADGSVEVLSSTVELGQGSESILSQIAAEALALPIDRVRMIRPDTMVTPYDRSTSSSRSSFMMGNAIKAAAAEIQEQLFAMASELLEVSTEDLELINGGVGVKGVPDRWLSYGEIIQRTHGGRIGSLTGRGAFQVKGGLNPEDGQGIGASFWETAAHACTVEVDVETGEVRMLDYVCAANVGRILNPVLCSGQLEGAAVMGMGSTFKERLLFSEGKPLNFNFLDYAQPTLLDIPPSFRTIPLEVTNPNGPFGAQGMGESAMVAVPAAVGNAIWDAVGVRIHELPITPEKVLAALRNGEGGDRHAKQDA